MASSNNDEIIHEYETIFDHIMYTGTMKTNPSVNLYFFHSNDWIPFLLRCISLLFTRRGCYGICRYHARSCHITKQQVNTRTDRVALFPRAKKAFSDPMMNSIHDDVIKWKRFPRYWPFVRGIHRSPVNSPHKGQWRGDLMFYLICAWISGWVNNCEAGDLRRYRAHYDATVMLWGDMASLCHNWYTWGTSDLVDTLFSNKHVIFLMRNQLWTWWL